MEKRMEKTDYKITEFHNSEFGSIRMIEDGGRLLFSGMDVAFALGYAKPRNAINVHCKGALKRGVLTSGGVQPMIFIPEGDVYRLITKSRLKSAQNFEKWVFDEVLPAIRKTGGYLETDLLDRVKDNPELLLEFAERLLAENNRNRELQNRVKDMQPKADYYDHFMIVIAMLQSQLFNLLCDKADDEYGGRLPVHVRVIADEFANIGQIPQFDKLIATIRSREISASIILQSQSQLKAMYKDSADTILGNCDTTLFLGGKEKTTLKEMSELLGKETIDLYNTSETRSNQKSFGLNYQKTGKQLMTEDEIAVMDGGKCILQIRGARPFFSDKYDITKHKNYRLLADENEKNRYKVEKELNPQYTPKSEEEVEVIHVELSE